jgi:hypothetical protein
MRGRVYGAPAKAGRRKQVRRKRNRLQFSTNKSCPGKELPTREVESCAGRGDPAGEA